MAVYLFRYEISPRNDSGANRVKELSQSPEADKHNL